MVPEDVEDYVNAEFSVFKEKFILPFMGVESDKRPYVINSVSDPIVREDGSFYDVVVYIYGKTAFVRYSFIMSINVLAGRLVAKEFKLANAFEKVFNTANYLAFRMSDQEFVSWLRNSDARLVVKYNYYVLDELEGEVYGSMEVGVYKKDRVIFSVGVMNDKERFYPAYFRVTKPFLRLHSKTQERIIKSILTGMFGIKNISSFRIKGFGDDVEETMVLNRIIIDMVRNVLPLIVEGRDSAFINPDKPIVCAYLYSDGGVVRELMNTSIKPVSL